MIRVNEHAIATRVRHILRGVNCGHPKQSRPIPEGLERFNRGAVEQVHVLAVNLCPLALRLAVEIDADHGQIRNSLQEMEERQALIDPQFDVPFPPVCFRQRLQDMPAFTDNLYFFP